MRKGSSPVAAASQEAVGAHGDEMDEEGNDEGDGARVEREGARDGDTGFWPCIPLSKTSCKTLQKCKTAASSVSVMDLSLMAKMPAFHDSHSAEVAHLHVRQRPSLATRWKTAGSPAFCSTRAPEREKWPSRTSVRTVTLSVTGHSSRATSSKTQCQFAALTTFGFESDYLATCRCLRDYLSLSMRPCSNEQFPAFRRSPKGQCTTLASQRRLSMQT